MSCVSKIVIDGVEYAPVTSGSSSVKICVLQRGWVLVGRFSRDGNQCKLTNASVIRRWGTTKGLGEIALAGPTSDTVLDPCGTVEFDYLTSIAIIDGSNRWSL